MTTKHLSQKQALTASAIFVSFLFSLIAESMYAQEPHQQIQTGNSQLQELEIDELRKRANLLGLAHSKQWQKILYYVPTWLQGPRSMIDSTNFFFAPRGKSDPAAELQATLHAFYEPIDSANHNTHPQCRFPARFKYLSDKLNLEDRNYFQALPNPECALLEEYLKGVAPEKVSLVFSDYYLNNPVSLFGHVFLRLSRNNNESKLLDMSVSFAADTVDTNTYLSMLTGPFGGPDGRFFVLPYYTKVQEYNNYEGRDLWEYELNYSSDEVQLITRSVWEISSVVIDYFYFDDNCALALLALLDVGRPDLGLSEEIMTIATPADSVKVVASRKNLIREKTYRPSSLSRFKNRYIALQEDEKELFEDLIEKRTTAALHEVAKKLEATRDSQKRVLDAGIEFFDHDLKLAAANVPLLEADKDFRTAMLMQRSKLGAPSSTLESYPPSPDRGHDTKRIGVSGVFPLESRQNETQRNAQKNLQKNEKSFGLGVSFRSALHDWSSPLVGYPAGVSIEFIHFQTVLWPETNEAELEQFTLFAVTSGQSYEPILRNVAWNLEFATARDSCSGTLMTEADACRFTFMRAGIGIAKEALQDFYVYAFPAQAKLGWHNEQKLTLDLEPRAGAHFSLWPQSRFHAFASFKRRFTQEQGDLGRFLPGGGVDVSQSMSRNTEIRLSARANASGLERAQLESFLYF